MEIIDLSTQASKETSQEPKRGNMAHGVTSTTHKEAEIRRKPRKNIITINSSSDDSAVSVETQLYSNLARPDKVYMKDGKRVILFLI